MRNDWRARLEGLRELDLMEIPSWPAPARRWLAAIATALAAMAVGWIWLYPAATGLIFARAERQHLERAAAGLAPHGEAAAPAPAHWSTALPQLVSDHRLRLLAMQPQGEHSALIRVHLLGSFHDLLALIAALDVAGVCSGYQDLKLVRVVAGADALASVPAVEGGGARQLLDIELTVAVPSQESR